MTTRIARRAGLLPALLAAATATAAIPETERAVLIDLYSHTNGAQWTNHDGWLGAAGTECEWYGVQCASPDHVDGLALGSNNLTGTLPSLVGLTMLSDFDVDDNAIEGSIPPLTGLVHLGYFDVSFNQMTGSLPQLTGLVDLQTFFAYGNTFTGTIPALHGLTHLTFFNVSNNQLTGSLPTLGGLSNLTGFNARSNQLTGVIPSLAGLTNLITFRVADNHLSGLAPSLTGLNFLEQLALDGNQLSGHLPQPSNHLGVGGAHLCPNGFTPDPDPAWDAATGMTPWYQDCALLPDPVYHSGFD